jgi:uncharacterized protein (TIGR03382 family)
VRYVDAGYAIALAVLALYALSLLARRRRLERAASREFAAEAASRGCASRATEGHDTVREDDESARAPRR